MTIYFNETISILSVFITFLAIMQAGGNYLKNVPGFKRLYPSFYIKYLKINIYTNLDIYHHDCNHVIVEGERADLKSQMTYQTPILICIPSNSSLKDDDKVVVTFNRQDHIKLTIYEASGEDLGDTISITNNDLKVGYERRFFAIVTINYKPININIKVEGKIVNSSNKSPRLIKPECKIDGQENNLEIKIN